ncbi:MAG: hypothetical protein FWG73_06970 [Planctomycetaceae bacterium]|nr:hypothetical protein [Planctomycetaceae bacterium]
MKHLVLIIAVSLAFVGSASAQFITYGEYGAVGDGVADDFDAIINAHQAANLANLPVQADAGATYYIGNTDKTAVIQTSTDWSGAKFMIDDSNVPIENTHIFHIASKLPAKQITAIAALKKGQDKIDLTLPQDSFVEVNDNRTRRYIRYGPNQNRGSAQTDVFIVDKLGNVDPTTPIIWDFDHISSMTAYPIDPDTLTITGGHFTTIANQAESRYTYYSRGISITRSNVVIDGIHHAITGELDHGAPYRGFILVSNCTNVLVQNSTFTGHKTYVTIGNAGTSVSMGSYDLSVHKANNVTFKNCTQTNCIHDRAYWGIFASNHSKNLTFDTVEFSRFDAHMGVTNATIKNSVLGHQGINLIGRGVFLLANTKVHSGNLINLRSDYGSTWDGEFIIRDSEFLPDNGQRADAILIGGSYTGQHDFGYICSLPRRIMIDGLIIDDRNHGDNYQGPKIFASFNRANTSAEYVERYPYVMTEEVILRNLVIKSGKPIAVSANPFMFRNVRVVEEETGDIRGVAERFADISLIVVMVFLVLLTFTTPILVHRFVILGERESTVNIVDSGIKIRGICGVKIDFAEIADISLIEDKIDSIGHIWKIWGYAAGFTQKGYFRSKKYGTVLLFTREKSSPTIHIQREGKADVFLNFSDNEETRTLYVDMKKVFGR